LRKSVDDSVNSVDDRFGEKMQVVLDKDEQFEVENKVEKDSEADKERRRRIEGRKRRVEETMAYGVVENKDKVLKKAFEIFKVYSYTSTRVEAFGIKSIFTCTV
jgi:hypothetical protein